MSTMCLKLRENGEISVFHFDGPSQALRPAQLEAGALVEAFVDRGARHGDHVLALPVPEEVEGLQGADDVLGLDGRHVADQADRQLSLVVPQDVHQHVRPVAATSSFWVVGAPRVVDIGTG